MRRRCPIALGLAAAAWLAVVGCRDEVPPGGLVVTQTPLSAAAAAAGPSLMDARYPAGSRVVLLLPPYQTNDVRVLSRGLAAAGDPVVAPDGCCVYFAGQAAAGGEWQIYQASLGGGKPRRVTSIAGGAMNPALVAGGNLVFASPVPPASQVWSNATPSALYAQAPGGSPRRLTFTPRSALEPTVLADGRILFVTVQPPTVNEVSLRTALFTINNDGTEFTAFAGQHGGGWPVLSRPRVLGDGRIAFLAAESPSAPSPTVAETVSLARPQQSRATLFPAACRSIEPGDAGEWLACVDTRGQSGRAMNMNFAVHRVADDGAKLQGPLFDDPTWNEVEAMRLAPHPQPQGHISTMTADRELGTILCLDVNDTSFRQGPATNRAARIRIEAVGDGKACASVELAPQPDGSFMVEAPADVPLTFVALDAAGEVVRRCPPLVWVRAGENRSCVGCHEPHNRSPRNIRPLAVNQPPVKLTPPTRAIAQVKP